MHNCRKTKKTLVDLVFSEPESAEQQLAQGALAEVRSCAACSAEYHAMLATLRAFDQAADAAMPEESYWAGYEARLRVKLAEPAALNFSKRATVWLTGLLARPAIPATITALILLAAISAVWVSRQEVSKPQVAVIGTTPIPSSFPAMSPTPQVNTVLPELHSTVAVKVKPTRRPRSVESAGETTPDTVAISDPATHLENAQLLLRAFRNAREGRNAGSANLAYERRQARKLVYANILLRREAEAKGNLPVEEALNSLEPLLLDIANLPAKASRGDVQTIRERIQKQEIIATLQIIATGTERFGAPALDQE